MVKNEENFIKMRELSRLSGVRYSTIKFYVEEGLIPFSQDGVGLVRQFNEVEAVKRLKEILKLKDKRFRIEEIKEKLL